MYAQIVLKNIAIKFASAGLQIQQKLQTRLSQLILIR